MELDQDLAVLAKALQLFGQLRLVQILKEHDHR
jgi:hypothetical protein